MVPDAEDQLRDAMLAPSVHAASFNIPDGPSNVTRPGPSDAVRPLAPPALPERDIRPLLTGIGQWGMQAELESRRLCCGPWKRLNIQLDNGTQCRNVWRQLKPGFSTTADILGAPESSSSCLPDPDPSGSAGAAGSWSGGQDHGVGRIQHLGHRILARVEQQPRSTLDPRSGAEEPDILENMLVLFALAWIEFAASGELVGDGPEDWPIRLFLEALARRVCPNHRLSMTLEEYQQAVVSDPVRARHALYHAMLRRFGPTVDNHGRQTWSYRN